MPKYKNTFQYALLKKNGKDSKYLNTRLLVQICLWLHQQIRIFKHEALGRNYLAVAELFIF